MSASKKRKPKAKSNKTPAATKRAIRIKADVDLINATIASDVAAVRMLLDAGADANAKDFDSGSSALHFAATYGCADCVRMLLDAGADANAKDSEEFTARDLAMDYAESIVFCAGYKAICILIDEHVLNKSVAEAAIVECTTGAPSV